MKKLNLLASIALFTLGFFSSAVKAEDGVSPDKIIFGQAAALEGAAAALGLGVQLGLQSAFDEANKSGEIKGRTLQLISENDGYEPMKAQIAAKKLIEEDKVFALIGSVGTPTSVAITHITEKSGVPFIAPYSGAESLSDPYKPDVVIVRASYIHETEAMVEHLTKELGVKKIAIFYQDDAFGSAGYDGVKKALDKRGMTLAGEGKYTRNTAVVDKALASIQASNPDAVIMIAAYKAAAEFIKEAKAAKLNATFVNISFVGTNALVRALGADAEGVYVTQVVPSPTDASTPIVRRYQEALKAKNAAAVPDYTSLEGYIDGRVTIEALNRVKGDVTRKGFLDAVSGINDLDLGGYKLAYGPNNNRGSKEVYLTALKGDGSVVPVEKMIK